MVTIKYADLELAFDFVSSASPFENRAFLSLDTGAMHWKSAMNSPDEEDLPDDLDISDRYLEIPHKNDLDLGTNLVFRFVDQHLPNRYADVEAFFHRRGAYARFKDLLQAERCVEKWHVFEDASTERALRRWCTENDIHLAENDNQQSA